MLSLRRSIKFPSELSLFIKRPILPSTAALTPNVEDMAVPAVPILSVDFPINNLPVPVSTLLLPSLNIAFSAGYVINISLVPALKSTAEVPLDPARTVVRERVLPVFQVPIPISHSSVPAVLWAIL